jgi:benzaldehyde dehydrogenase (NAD)
VSAPPTTQSIVDTVRRAGLARPGWAGTPAPARAELLVRAAGILAARAGDVAAALVSEAGSARLKAHAEVQGAVGELHAAAGLAMLPTARVLPSRDPGREVLATRVPVGVVGVITPWNFPLLLALRSVAPALALGNAVVLKPDPNTPHTGGDVLAEVFAAAGLPDGVFQVVHGDAEVGTALVDAADMISFTGSTAVGRAIGARAGAALKKVVLELGGQKPFIVPAGADVARAASAGAWGSFFHQGQVCMSTRRHLVHRDLAEEYVAALAGKADALVLGEDLGPIINAAQLAGIEAAVRQALADGAALAAGGSRQDGYYRPTVLTAVTPDMAIFRTETFGPVATVTVFDTEDEAVALANGTEYGLVAAVWTDDTGTGQRIAARLAAGVVHVGDQTVHHEAQLPFGGVGASGNGAGFGGEASVEAFTRWRTSTVSSPARAYPY